MPQNSLVEFLLRHNERQSEIFCSSDAALTRRQYRHRHTTEIVALKCMDGRLHLPLMTGTPPGIIQPYRNMAGIFDLGWPYFGELMEDWVRYAVRMGRNCVVLVTYHWSDGDPHRGCRGFNYDMTAARAYTVELKAQIERVFGRAHAVVYPIRIGIETDTDTFVIHGESGETLNLSDHLEMTNDTLHRTLHRLFPDMKDSMVNDLLPLLLGNISHVARVKSEGRPIAEAHHREQVLAVGRGFQWLHLPNKALIIGPYTYDLATPVGTAARILWSNMEEGRIPRDEGFVLLTSAVYRDEAGPERFRAIEKTRSFARFALETIQSAVPELREQLAILPGIVNLNTLKFTEIPFTG